MAKFNIKLNKTQWFIVLWLAGFLGLALIAGLFKMLLLLAYP
ncbi:DUF2474 domain-containing protein [Acinetobacter larvae]|nr:DUF2474 domain-containing protein [Acinetobacter larvae]